MKTLHTSIRYQTIACEYIKPKVPGLFTILVLLPFPARLLVRVFPTPGLSA